MEELTVERRKRWISAISRENLTDSILENDRVCSKHFVSGEPAKDWDRFNVDWFPTLCLGHSKQQVKDPEAAEVRSRRAADRERRKRRSELLENEIKKKMLKIDEPGETYLFPRRMGWVKTSNKMEQRMLSKPTVKFKVRVKDRSIVTEQRWTLELRQ